ncbi:MAG: ribosome biogenesis GTPase Der [Chromatiaceae bacterium]|mgnify:FL=1|nr:ribosome biogenesis GTPase Der [Chromatiaceae bacterium]MCP5429323.1 ribosome biogenesis GTPase Der [Chromatiaceae bacterium]MCW5586167.1 ribosome biogenesis GTPase Der [Chromatiales bacterium]HOP16885.1 ribosome biogenesis GTPase Der [Gammaproteobacteria bacterium]HPQ23680.1 ribosome biogenesis GTPase Der [Gammaproteobacteria bacterium]
MLPVIALVGRPNVGKSTLFNRLTRTRDALVADQPGLTRDRKYGIGRLGSRPYVVVDTGGLSGDREGVDVLMERQVRLAIGEADLVFFILDGRDGLTAGDQIIAEGLRRTGKSITLVINKTESLDYNAISGDFHALGLGEPVPIAAAHGRGVHGLINQVLDALPDDEGGAETEHEPGIQIAVVGRPNVGKSTLVNRLLGEDRVVTFDEPGTTRDSIYIPFESNGKRYTLIDTAGVRRRAKISETIEKFSVIKTLQAIEQANVILLVLDAKQGISDQDAGLAGHVVESGRALVVVINKWDGLSGDERDRVKSEMQRRLPFLDFAEWRFVSALHGSGVGHLLSAVDASYAAAMSDLKTPELTRILEAAVAEHQPPLVHGRRIKLRYAHQGGKNPPIIIIHGNQTADVPATYQRYLMNRFRSVLQLRGTPLRIEFKTGENPFAGKRNKLTERQLKKRGRMMKFVGKKK